MSISIHVIKTGPWRQNGYVVIRPDREALIIDPGAEPDRFIATIEIFDAHPVAILNTHGHYDHVGAIRSLVEAYDIPFYLFEQDWKLLRQANFYRKIFGGDVAIELPSAAQKLENGGLTISGFAIKVVATPGHTEGSACFVIEDAVFTGDTLLSSGYGRVDLPGASKAKMKDVAHILAGLDSALMAYPGHGRPFELGSKLAEVGVTL